MTTLTVNSPTQIRRCDEYLRARTGRYEWRCERYSAVAEKMIDAGLCDGDMVIDVGAGWTEFDVYLRDLGWRGRYFPVDGSLDGTDLEVWFPPREAEFIVAIELLEHLQWPGRLAQAMTDKATKLVAITTPNPETTDVLGMDATHQTEIWPFMMEAWGFKHEVRSFYGQRDDSLLAWREA